MNPSQISANQSDNRPPSRVRNVGDVQGAKLDKHERCSRINGHREKMLELFAEKGFGQVGMRELASHVGLSVGSLYHHYPSKQHLLLDVIEEFYEELMAVLDCIEQQAPARQGLLPAIIQAHLKLHLEMPCHFRLVERDIGCLNGEQREQVRPLREHYERSLFALLRPSAACLGPRAVADAAIIAHLLTSAPGWLTQQSLEPRERDALLQCLVSGGIDRVLDRGI
jgi:AcrR family transcriptional regulator